MTFDKVALGFVVGLLFPVVGFFLYASIYVTIIRPHLDVGYFVNDLFLGTSRYRSPVLSLSLLANLGPFFWFDRLDLPRAMRGVILASFLYAVLIVALWIIG
ncbi:MAG: hypothetical protein R2815_01130 [Flavobacteriales bacterium]|nr:hypothetical protein [Flavobacteriales bacterium]